MLPKINTPIYELKLPSTEKKVSYRPFVTGEEKTLKMAQETGNVESVISTTKNIIKNCTFNKLDVDNLPYFDLEYIYIKLHEKSVNEISHLTFECKCKTIINYALNLAEINVDIDKNKKDIIELLPNIGVKLKYPSIDVVEKFNTNKLDVDIIIDCIEYVYTEEEIIKREEISKEELLDWINQFTPKQFKAIEDFFIDLPQLKHDIKLECSECKEKYEYKLEGLFDFLD